MHTLHPSRQLARSRRRGVALVEALIVSSLSLIFLGGIWFMFELNDRKGDTLREARYQAWAGTRPECQGASARGRGVQSVSIPSTMQGGAGAAGQLSVQSSLELACNQAPQPQSDMVAALRWAGSEIDLGSLFQSTLDDVTSKLPSIDLNPFN